MKKLILASTSLTRKKLLADAGLSFDIASSDYEEDMSLPLPPKELAIYLSKGKAKSVAKNYREGVVIGADTTDKEIDNYVATGEPLNKAGAYAILELGASFIKKVEGSRSSIAGLPMEELMEVLKEFNIKNI